MNYEEMYNKFLDESIKKIYGKEPRVLVLRLTTDKKLYCMKDFLDACNNVKEGYKTADIICYDNSKEDILYLLLKRFNIPVIKTDYYRRDEKGNIIIVESEDGKTGKKIIPIRELMVRDMNLGRQKVLDENYDFMFILEQDMKPTKTTLKELLVWNKDVCNAFYWLDLELIDVPSKRGDNLASPVPYYKMDYTEKNEPIVGIIFPMNEKDLFPSRLVKMSHSGFGACLIKRKVLEKVKFFYDKEEPAQVDAWFYQDVYLNGFEAFVHTGIICGHNHRDWDKNTLA